MSIISHLSLPASEVACIMAAGAFFLIGLITGVWKYQKMRVSLTGEASRYVDISHRSSLLYSFASILLYVFAQISQLPQYIELPAVLAQLLFFAMAIASYVLHGILSDTDRQLSPPYQLGKYSLPSFVIGGFMWSLAIFEIGGFAILFYGVIEAIF